MVESQRVVISLAQFRRHTANAGKLRIFSPCVELLAPPVLF